MKYRFNCLRWILASIGCLWLSLRLHVEWNWFGQFGWQDVLARRLLWQFIGFAISIIFISLNYYWLHSWRMIDKHNRNTSKENRISRGRYGILLAFNSLIQFLVVVILFMVILILLWWLWLWLLLLLLLWLWLWSLLLLLWLFIMIIVILFL